MTDDQMPDIPLVENILEKANDIMDEAVETAGKLLTTKPHIAEIILKQLLKCDPEHLSGLQLLGLCKHRMGENAEAVEIIQTVIELDPTNSDNYNNLGLAYGGLGDHDRAIEVIKKAIELNPEQFLFKNNLALQYRSKGDYDMAVRTLREGLAQKEQQQLWLNLGGIYGEMRDIAEAKRCFERALQIDPEYPAAHVDLAFTHYLLGDWANGFKEHEWRFWYYPQMQFYQKAYDPEKWWQGEAFKPGSRFLIYGEQGLGDTIQFVRYVKFLKERGAHVTVHCPPNLDGLVKRVEGVDATNNRDIVNESGPEFPEYDYQFSMMSFPHLLKKMPPEVGGAPYITPITDKFRDYMKQQYPDTMNIGIVWAGSASHPHDKKRSIPLKYFKPLQDIPGVKLFSLQMDIRARQYGVSYRNSVTQKLTVDETGLEKFQAESEVVDYCEGCEDIRLTDLTQMIQNFEDTATLVAGLDMVIACDTAVVHLAGAMGKPTWVALPYNPDWRWLVEGDTTVWYDTMRLYRQPQRDDWASVFERIERDLRETVLQNQR